LRVYAIKEAMKSMVRARYMSFISIVSITITLIVLGVFSVITFFVNGMVQKVRKSEEINVYLKDDMSDEDMLALDATIASMKEVTSTRILSKEDAAEEFEKIFGSDLLSSLEENPLPRTIVVSMAEGYRMSSDIENVAARIKKVENIDSVEYGKDWMSKMDVFFLMFVVGETILIAVVISACLLIISNTISLTVIAREETIEIMRLVGATDAFIRRPFYIEGLLEGLISGSAAFCVMYGAYRWIHYAVPDLHTYIFMFTIPEQSIYFPDWSSALIIPLGGILGLFGSYTGVRSISKARK